jgi:hypothetical protein
VGMKAILVFLGLLICGRSFAQQLTQVPVDATTHLVTYVAVVQAPHITQADLLSRARVWANGVAIPGKPPLLLREQETDVVMVIGSQALNTSYFNTSNAPRTLYYTATIALRNGRYQYRLTDFVLETADGTTHLQPTIASAESTFLAKDPPRADGISYGAHVRKTFDEAIGQLTASIRSTLAASLITNPTAGDNW